MQITMQLFIRKIRNRWLSPSTVHKGAPAQVELCFCYCLCLEGIGCTGRTAEQSPVSFGTGCCGLLRKGTRETCGACCWAEMCTYIMISSLDRSCRCFSGLYTSQPTSNRQVTDPWYPFESAAPCILHTSYRWVRPGFHGHGLVAIPVATGTSAWVRHIVASLRVSFPVFVKLVSSMKKGSPLSLSISNTIYRDDTYILKPSIWCKIASCLAPQFILLYPAGACGQRQQQRLSPKQPASQTSSNWTQAVLKKPWWRWWFYWWSSFSYLKRPLRQVGRACFGSQWRCRWLHLPRPLNRAEMQRFPGSSCLEMERFNFW